MLYLRFCMRTKCVCCIAPYPRLHSRANIISQCQASFSDCPRRNHQPVAGIRAGGYLISVATHRGGLIQLSWFTTSIKAVSILSASLCLPVKRERVPVVWYIPAHRTVDSQKQNRSGATERKGFRRLRLTNSGRRTDINSLRFESVSTVS